MVSKRARRVWLVLVVVIIYACAPLFAPAANIAPTLSPAELEVVIAQTAAFAATQTALNSSPTPTTTLTPLPTKTPTVTPTDTPTFVFLLSSPTSINPTLAPNRDGSGNYACEIISQNPANKTTFHPRDKFDAVWRVKNVGKAVWDSNNDDYRYSEGDKFHDIAVYDLPKTVAPDDEIDIVVDMTAPKNPGNYTTTWRISAGKTEFCRMTLTIVVK